MKEIKTLYPLLVKSNLGLHKYYIEKDIIGLPEEPGSLLTVDCQRIDNTKNCVAAGYLGDIKEHTKPLLIQSLDAGRTWEVKSVTGLTQGLIKKISCSGNDSNFFCAGIGWKVQNLSDEQSAPFVIYSKNLTDWIIKHIKNVPKYGTLTTL